LETKEKQKREEERRRQKDLNLRLTKFNKEFDLIFRNRCEDLKIGLKDFRLFLLDFGILKSLETKSNNLEYGLANELWKSLTRYEPTD
jgi:phage antirepressor YoqD-like protein